MLLSGYKRSAFVRPELGEVGKEEDGDLNPLWSRAPSIFVSHDQGKCRGRVMEVGWLM